MLLMNSVKVEDIRGMVWILNFGLSIWKVFLEHSMIPTTRFIRGCLIPFNIDGCINRSRPLESVQAESTAWKAVT